MNDAIKLEITKKLIEAARKTHELNDKMVYLLQPNGDCDGYEALGEIADPIMYAIGQIAGLIPEEHRPKTFLMNPGRNVGEITLGIQEGTISEAARFLALNEDSLMFS